MKRPILPLLLILPLTLIALFAIFAWWAMRRLPVADTVDHSKVCDRLHPELCEAPKQQQGRAAFDSAVSPDGNWREVVVNSPDAHPTWPNQIMVCPTRGEAPCHSLVRSTQNPTREEWSEAGWSFDGQKVYYVASPPTHGRTGSLPIVGPAYSALYEVDAFGTQPSQPRLVLHPLGEYDALQGIHDMYAQKNLVVYSEVFGNKYAADYTDTLYLSDLHNTSRKGFFFIDRGMNPNHGIATAVISPSATKIYIVEWEMRKNSHEYRYTPYMYDIASGTLTERGGFDTGEYSGFEKWTDDRNVQLLPPPAGFAD